MIDQLTYVILGMALVTYIPRMLPLVVISKINLPEMVEAWLKYIPVSILSALLTMDIISFEETSYYVNSQVFLAMIPTILVASKTKSLLKTVLAGIITMAILNQI